MTIDIEDAVVEVHNKPLRKDVIGEFHKKIIHEDTERGEFKISMISNNGNSSHHPHTIISVGSGGGGGGSSSNSIHQAQSSSTSSSAHQPTQLPQNPAATAANKHNIERPPISRGQSGLPLTISKSSAAAAAAGHEPRLIPRSLRIIPLHVRFALNGLLSNVLFTVADNWAVSRRSAAAAAAAAAATAAAAAAASAASDSETGTTAASGSAWFWMFWKWNLYTLSPSAIYSILYLIFIPISHAMACIFVFGWPERYLPSLLSNCPIGLCAMILGATLTAYLNSIQFNEMVVEYLEEWAEYIRNNFTFHEMPRRGEDQPNGNGNGDEGQFYTSLAVLFVTNLWTYLSSLYVNSTPQKSEKKEL